MQELIGRILESGLADFEGLEISGTLPLKDSLLNEAIAAFLQSAKQEKAAGAAPDPAEPAQSGPSLASQPSSRPAVPVSALLTMVRVLEVQAVEGKLLVRFVVSR